MNHEQMWKHNHTIIQMCDIPHVFLIWQVWVCVSVMTCLSHPGLQFLVYFSASCYYFLSPCMNIFKLYYHGCFSYFFSITLKPHVICSKCYQSLKLFQSIFLDIIVYTSNNLASYQY